MRWRWSHFSVWNVARFKILLSFNGSFKSALFNFQATVVYISISSLHSTYHNRVYAISHEHFSDLANTMYSTMISIGISVFYIGIIATRWHAARGNSEVRQSITWSMPLRLTTCIVWSCTTGSSRYDRPILARSSQSRYCSCRAMKKKRASFASDVPSTVVYIMLPHMICLLYVDWSDIVLPRRDVMQPWRDSVQP